MVDKTNTDKQITFKKKKYKVTNWSEYNQSLVNRGVVTIWLGDEVAKAWNNPDQSGKPGHPKTYSDLAIRSALTIQAVYHLPLRATEGFVQSLLFLMGYAHLKSPDYSTLSYRAQELEIPMSQAVKTALSQGEPLHIAIDSTGVKIYGEGEWKVRKHGWTKRRLWRKVHLGVDVSTNLIPTSETTDQNKADSYMVEPLLNQLPEEIKVSKIYGDGAYDKWDLYDLCMDKNIELVAPPKANARDQYYPPGDKEYHKSQSIRNKVVIQVDKEGMDIWKKESNYHKRSLSETAMFRVKTVFGSSLTARTMTRQITQVKLRIAALNEMTLLGMPQSVPIT